MSAQVSEQQEQAQQLRRVNGRIGPIVVKFCTERVERGDIVFHGSDLLKYVQARHPGTAPGSPNRILRALRCKGLIAWSCTNRAASEYTLEAGEWLND